MAVFSLNAKQFREVSLQIYFILFLLESPIEVSFSFSSQQQHICCTICRMWVPSCFFMQPIYCTLHSFLGELKGQIFYTKSLILLLILVGCFLCDFSVMYVLVTRKVEFRCLMFHTPQPNHEQLSLTIGAHHWMVIWCSLRLLSCSLFPGSICTGLELLGNWDATTAQGKGFLMELLMAIIA